MREKINARQVTLGAVVKYEGSQWDVITRNEAKGYLTLRAVGQKGRWAARRTVEFWREIELELL
jgi:hypothetical protein